MTISRFPIRQRIDALPDRWRRIDLACACRRTETRVPPGYVLEDAIEAAYRSHRRGGCPHR
jgi:hypothetical protein